MKVVVVILVVLFASLFIVLPLVEKYGREYSGEELSKIGRWFIPLCALMLVAQLLMHFFSG